MPITSLLVKTKNNPQEIALHISQLPSVEVTDINEQTLVVVTETESVVEDKAIWSLLESAPGVSGVTAIYHNFEDLNLDPSGCIAKDPIDV